MVLSAPVNYSFPNFRTYTMNVSRNSFIKFIWILLVGTLFFGDSNESVEITKEFTMYLNMLGNLTSRHLQESKYTYYMTLIIHPQVKLRMISAIIKLYSASVPVHACQIEKSVASCEPSYRKVQDIVAISTNIQDIELHRWRSSFGKSWNPRARFVVWIVGNVSGDAIKDLFSRFWTFDCANVIVVVCQPGAQVLTYDPFAINGNDSRGKVSQLSELDYLFPDKFNNLFGYSIPVSLYHDKPFAVLENHTKLKTGRDVHIWRYLARWLNFSIRLKNDPVMLRNYSSHLSQRHLGPIEDVVANRSHLLGNEQYIDVLMDKNVEFLNPFWLSKYTILVWTKKDIYFFINKIDSNAINTILLILLVLLLLIPFSIFWKYKAKVVILFELFLQQRFNKIGTTFPERTVMLCYIIWSMRIALVFQANMTHKLTLSPAFDMIDTVEKLYQSNHTFVIDEFMLNSMKYSHRKYNQLLAERAVTTMSLFPCMERLLSLKNNSCCMDHTLAVRIVNSFLKENDEQNHLCEIDQKLGNFWLTFAVKKGFPYLDKINKGITKLIELGLIAKWSQTTQLEDLEFKIKSVKGKLKKEANILIMRGALLLLAFGFAVSTLVFILEFILCSKFKAKFLNCFLNMLQHRSFRFIPRPFK